MPIENIQSNPYNTYGFGTLTQGAGSTARPEGYQVGYHQARSEAPIQAPLSFGIPTTEDMELAQKIYQSGISGVDNPFVTAKAPEKGYVPDNNGEISPVIEGREDEIEDCPWREYYA